MRVAPDANRERTTLLPEEISKLGSPSASIQPSFASDEGEKTKTVFKKSSLIESGVENVARICTVPAEKAGQTISPPGRRRCVVLVLLLLCCCRGGGEGGDD
jgi:hypothetical protein